MTRLITESLDIWSSAQKPKKTGGRGRGKTANGGNLYGIKKLRELILELAVRGKLVPQDPNDEPASELLKKIAQEKARLIKEGKIKKQKKLPEIGEEEKPFELPEGWEWTRLGNVTNYGVSDKVEPNTVAEDTWILELEDVEKETSKILQKVRFADRQFRSSKNRFSKGDVIYGKLRPYLDKVIIADENGVCTTEMIPLKGYNHIIPTYLRLVMKSPYFVRYANESTHGMNLPRMGTDKARLALFPITTEAEQHRIVAKVDELMALCDRLEEQQTASDATHQTLLQTLFTTLTNAADHNQFNKAWQRLAKHFDTLFTTEKSIDQLKQTILQLAVMGKLVPQNPNDEPASELLKKIAQEKARLIKEGKIKKQKKLPEISDDEKPFELPEGWEWVRMGEIINFKTGKLDSNAAVENGQYPFFTCAKEALLIDQYDFDCEAVLLAGNNAAGKYNVKKYEGKFNAYQRTYILTLEFGRQQALGYSYLKNLLEYMLVDLQEKSLGSLTRFLTLGILKPIPLLLPPLAEQHRIVAKVDELMALCDTLKDRLTEAQTTQLQLADTVVNLNGGQA